MTKEVNMSAIRPKNGETASAFVIRFKNKQRALALYLECRKAASMLRQARLEKACVNDFSKGVKPLLQRDINRVRAIQRRYATDAKYFQDEPDVKVDEPCVKVDEVTVSVVDVDTSFEQEPDDIPTDYLRSWFNPTL